MSLSITKYPERIVDGQPPQLSRWSAVHHKMIFGMERQDFQVGLGVHFNDPAKMFVFITAGMLPNTIQSYLQSGDEVYIETANWGAVFTVITVSVGNLFSVYHNNLTFTQAEPGFINFLNRKNYYIKTNIWGVDAGNNYYLVGTSTNVPSAAGRVEVDVSSFLKNIVGYVDDFKYDSLNEKDILLGGLYNITYSENWSGQDGEWSGISNTIARFFVNSAKQIQDVYGENMALYVPFFFASPEFVSPFALFLSDFKSPTYFPGFPFSISFIYSEYLIGVVTNKMEEEFGINNNPLFPIDVKPLDNSQVQNVNRLMINENYGSTTECIEIWLESDGTVDCLKYWEPGYVQVGYVEEVCGPPIIGDSGPVFVSDSLNL